MEILYVALKALKLELVTKDKWLTAYNDGVNNLQGQYA